MNTTKILNLTPHAITILNRDGIEMVKGSPVAAGSPTVLRSIAPSGAVARAAQAPAVDADPIDGIPTRTPGAFGAPVDLPAPAVDTYFVVSILTVGAARASGRTVSDLLTPDPIVRDVTGNIVGALGFGRHV